MFQSCTLSYFQIRGFKIKDKAKNAASVELKDECHYKYFVSVEANPRQYTRKPTYPEERLKDDIRKYIEATQETFNRKGCTAIHTNNEYEATFKIKVLMSPLWSATGKAKITYLSFGLIPTWEINRNEYTYTFENEILKKENVYAIDEKNYHHLIFFPVFWVSFINLNNINTYKASLTNFIEDY